MVNTEIRMIISFAAKDGEALYSQQKQDLELTVAQIMNSLLKTSDLKKVWKTTRPFRYDLNQVPCNYIVEVRLHPSTAFQTHSLTMRATPFLLRNSCLQ